MTGLEIPRLTPLRGLAAVLVAVYHGLMFVPPLKEALAVQTAFFDRGYLWVDFFFMLSGFIMAHVYGDRFRRKVSASDVRQFLIARFARVYPLHVLVLLAFVGLILAISLIEGTARRFEEERYSLFALVTNLLLLQALGIHDTPTWNWPAWSISVEWYTYLTFPFLSLFVHRFVSGAATLLVLGAATLGVLHLGLGFEFDLIEMTCRFGFWRCLAEFAIGLALYKVAYKADPSWREQSAIPLVSASAVVIAALHIRAVNDLAVIAAMAGLLVAAARYRGARFAWADGAAGRWLGDVSYSVYLVHALILEGLSKLSMMLGLKMFGPWPSPATASVTMLIFLAITLLVAHGCYHLFEVPARRLIKARLLEEQADGAGTLLVVDPIGFFGGSKGATATILTEVRAAGVRIEVLSRDRAAWTGAGFGTHRLRLPRCLSPITSGPLYVVKHGLLAMQVLHWIWLHGPVRGLIGASGPGTDFCLHIVRRVVAIPVIQFVHGPVAPSRLAAHALQGADSVFYLDGTCASLEATLGRIGRRIPAHGGWLRFVNGLPASRWPQAATHARPAVLWVASLIAWKRLDVLLDALAAMPNLCRPETHVCFIRPQGTSLATTAPRTDLAGVYWHESPPDLDVIRSRATIFVSTSLNEPFGLSILEALAAGLCVVLPDDGSYWARRLTHGRDCIKVRDGDAAALRQCLDGLIDRPGEVAAIGARGRSIAQAYRSEHLNREVVSAILSHARPHPVPSGPTPVAPRMTLSEMGRR